METCTCSNLRGTNGIAAVVDIIYEFLSFVHIPQARTKSYAHGWLIFRGRQLTMTVSERYKLCAFDQHVGANGGHLLYLGHAVELYDLKSDPSEHSNIYGKVDNPEIRQLLEEHAEYFYRYGVNQKWVLSKRMMTSEW